MELTDILDVFDITRTGVEYFFYNIAYYLVYDIDLVYMPFAGFFNATGQLVTALNDLFIVCLSWTGDTFMWFLTVLVSIYVFFFAVRLLILLKEIILRWL